MHLVWMFFVGAVMCAILRRWYPREAGWLAAAVSLAVAAMALRLLLSESVGVITLVDAWLGEIPRVISFVFDPLSILVVAVIATIGLVAALATLGNDECQMTPLLLVATGASIGAVLAGEMSTFYAFSLLLSLCLAAALMQKGQAGSAAQMFLVVEGAGVLFLFASMYLDIATGTSRLSGLLANSDIPAVIGADWLFAAFAGFVIVRTAWVPLHTWATTAGNRLSAAGATWIIVLPPVVGLYFLVRSWTWLIRLQMDWGILVFQAFGAATILVCSYAALHQRSLRRVATFVAIAWTGFIPLGLNTFTSQGSDAAVYHLVSFGLVAPLLFLSLARLGEALRQAEPQEPLSFTLALLGALAGLGAPATVGFIGQIVLVESVMAAPGASFPILLVFLVGTAFITLAILGAVRRVAERGAIIGAAQQPAEDLLLQPAVMALAIPAALSVILGITSPFWADTIGWAAVDISPLSGPLELTVRGLAWVILLALAGPGLGLLLYMANRECSKWRWKLLGIQQCSVVSPEPWWSYLENISPYQALRLLMVGTAGMTARGLEFLAGRIAR